MQGRHNQYIGVEIVHFLEFEIKKIILWNYPYENYLKCWFSKTFKSFLIIVRLKFFEVFPKMSIKFLKFWRNTKFFLVIYKIAFSIG